MITVEEGRRYLGIMPAVAEDVMGLNVVSFYLDNAGTAVPTHLAVIVLLRADTGEPLAVMAGRLITEMRTAAVSAAVTKSLAPPVGSVLALRGRGVQAQAGRVRRPEGVRTVSKSVGIAVADVAAARPVFEASGGKL